MKIGTVMKDKPRCRKLQSVIQSVAFLTFERPLYLSIAFSIRLFRRFVTKPPPK